MAPSTELDRSGIIVPILGFGSAPVASLYRTSGDDLAFAVMRLALDQGVSLFDTAPLPVAFG